jgi:hypothetical protein
MDIDILVEGRARTLFGYTYRYQAVTKLDPVYYLYYYCIVNQWNPQWLVRSSVVHVVQRALTLQLSSDRNISRHRPLVHKGVGWMTVAKDFPHSGPTSDDYGDGNG